MKYYTSIKQSKKLLELGLNYETADMFYDGIQDLYKEKVYNIPENGSSITVRTGHIITERGIKNNLLLPCWSLGALLNLIPLPVLFMEITGGCITWVCEAHKLDGKIIHAKVGIDIIEAIYNMMIWLLENNYIEK